MSLETAIQNLADAINRLSYIQIASVDRIVGAEAAGQPEPEKRGRGRPPGKAKPEPTAAPEEFPVEDPADKVAARIAAVSAEASAPVPAPAPLNVTINKQLLQNTLIELVKKHGRDACGNLCRKHGGPNLSALPESVYPAVYADALKLIEQPAQA
jgi:hypothetical protein